MVLIRGGPQSLAVCLLFIGGCIHPRSRSLDEAVGRLRVGQSKYDVRAIMRGDGVGESSIGQDLGEPYYPFAVDVPKVRANARTFYVSEETIVVVCFRNDKLVAWNSAPNKNPLLNRAKRLVIGMPYGQVVEIMGKQQSDDYSWNGKWVGRRMIYSEGGSSFLTGARFVQIDFIKEKVVRIKVSPPEDMGWDPPTWDESWTGSKP